MDRFLVNTIDPQLATLIGHNGVPAAIGTALNKSAGARFYKCALQVNSFEYGGRHAKKTAYTTEEDYNSAIVAACRKEGIEVVGITDHFRTATSVKLADALRAAGVFVFLGFEASPSEGVHLPCLFPDSTSADEFERIIGACGFTGSNAASPNSDKTCEQLIQLIPKMGGITVAAHACSTSGLLTTLRGQHNLRGRAVPCEIVRVFAGSGRSYCARRYDARVGSRGMRDRSRGRSGIECREQRRAWKELDQLSTGQKATAVLLLLLLESDAR